MEYTTLGSSGLCVSVMGLGCGGPSRVGQSTGKSEDEQVAIIRQALDSGINFIDTTEAYYTEEVVGRAIKGLDRDAVVISTKKSTWEGRLTSKDVAEGLEASLKRLGLDYVDVYHLHGVAWDDYDYHVTEIVPALQKLREQGKIRFIGITEQGSADPGHEMLQRAIQDGVWDVMIVVFNIINQSARERVLATCIEKDIGVLVMYAVRRALSIPERLREVVQKLIGNGQVDPSDVDQTNPLGFLLHEGCAVSIPDAAYRFCRDEPGIHVILSGTGIPNTCGRISSRLPGRCCRSKLLEGSSISFDALTRSQVIEPQSTPSWELEQRSSRECDKLRSCQAIGHAEVCVIGIGQRNILDQFLSGSGTMVREMLYYSKRANAGLQLQRRKTFLMRHT